MDWGGRGKVEGGGFAICGDGYQSSGGSQTEVEGIVTRGHVLSCHSFVNNINRNNIMRNCIYLSLF